MTIEPDTFQQIRQLSPEDILELVDTVSRAALLNNSLTISPQDKFKIAYTMITHAYTMLEQCGYEIETTITNSKHGGVEYKTGMDNDNVGEIL
ncbi:hypothetical protein LCGC14_0219740 [marine sediment metagenome]|uniref:Uncharacterized protein n=1 Tax=marine sediment metagenome TaxID=412755 RepID=A0A0F9UHG8_9ZZZZ